MAALSATARRFPPAARLRRFGLGLTVVVLMAVAGLAWIAWRSAPGSAPSAVPSAVPARPMVIVARGRIETASRMRVVSGPSGGGTVTELRVTEGQRLVKGDVVAVLDGHGVRQAVLDAARLGVAVAEREEERLAAGRTRQLDGLAALVAIATVELAQQQRQAERGRALQDSQTVSRERMESLTLDLSRGQQVLARARAELETAQLNLNTDRRVAALRVAQERGAVDRAAAELELTLVRAPIAGTVLGIAAQAGTAIGPDGVVTLADLEELVVIAEVAAADAPRIRPGDPATVDPTGSGPPLPARVVRLQNRVFSTQRPTSDVLTGRDARVVEAELAIDPPGRLPPFIDAEVVAMIRSTGP